MYIFYIFCIYSFVDRHLAWPHFWVICCDKYGYIIRKQTKQRTKKEMALLVSQNISISVEAKGEDTYL